MDVVLKKVGKDIALVIPATVLKALRIGPDHHMVLDVTSDGKIVLSPTRKFSLSKMIAQCDLNALPPADLQLWNESSPRGQEIL